MVVVLPVPFTPTTSTTCGALAGSSGIGGATGRGSRRSPRPAPPSPPHRSTSLPKRVPAEASTIAGGGRDAEIGGDQHFLQLLQRLLVEPALGEQRGDAVGQPGGGARQAGLEAATASPRARLRPACRARPWRASTGSQRRPSSSRRRQDRPSVPAPARAPSPAPARCRARASGLGAVKGGGEAATGGVAIAAPLRAAACGAPCGRLRLERLARAGWQRRLGLRVAPARVRRLAAQRGRADPSAPCSANLRQQAAWRRRRSPAAGAARRAGAAADQAIAAKCAVWPRSSRSNSTASSCARAAPGRTAPRWPAPAARSRAARDSVTRHRHRGIRAAGVPGRSRIGKDVQEGECRSPPTRSRRFVELASVSVGKPAMRSAPKAMSGRSAAGAADEVQRIGAQVAALHALQDQVVAVLQATGADAASAAARRRSAARGPRRSRPGRARTAAGAAVPAPAPAGGAPSGRGSAPGQVGAVAGDVDAGQHDLAVAVRHQRRTCSTIAPIGTLRGLGRGRRG